MLKYTDLEGTTKLLKGIDFEQLIQLEELIQDKMDADGEDCLEKEMLR